MFMAFEIKERKVRLTPLPKIKYISPYLDGLDVYCNQSSRQYFAKLIYLKLKEKLSPEVVALYINGKSVTLKDGWYKLNYITLLYLSKDVLELLYEQLATETKGLFDKCLRNKNISLNICDLIIDNEWLIDYLLIVPCFKHIKYISLPIKMPDGSKRFVIIKR